MSLNIAYNSTGGRHLNRPINVNPVNPPASRRQLAQCSECSEGWACTASHGRSYVEPADGRYG